MKTTINILPHEWCVRKLIFLEHAGHRPRLEITVEDTDGSGPRITDTKITTWNGTVHVEHQTIPADRCPGCEDQGVRLSKDFDDSHGWVADGWRDDDGERIFVEYCPFCGYHLAGIVAVIASQGGLPA